MATLFTKIKIRLKQVFTKHMNPHRYWILVLRIFFVVCVLLVIGNFYLLYQIKTAQIFQVQKSSSSSAVVNADLLQNVTSSLSQKAQTQEIIKDNPPLYSDPSL
jgi:hypothetical protein